MTYLHIAGIVIGVALLGGASAWLLHRTVRLDTLRRHHVIGSAVATQLGVVFAVLLAFVFNEVWSEYNIAADAIQQECASLHGLALLSDSLPEATRLQVQDAIANYASAVIADDWPAMAQNTGSHSAVVRLTALWRAVTQSPGAAEGMGDLRAQMLTMLARAHQMRETRLADAATDVPVVLWVLLLTFAVAIVGTLLCFGVEYIWSQVAFTTVFVGCIVFTLLLVHALDRPFNGALRIDPVAFQQLLLGVHRPG